MLISIATYLFLIGANASLFYHTPKYVHMQLKQTITTLVLALSLGLVTSSCQLGHSALYSWHKYDSTIYSYTRSQTPEQLAALVEQYERLIDRQSGMRKMPPPGICAEYGYLLLKTGKREQGLEMLRREIANYPESEAFIARIIKQFS